VPERNIGPEVVRTLEEFAILLRKADRNEEAVTLEARAKAIRAELLYTVKIPGRRQ